MKKGVPSVLRAFQLVYKPKYIILNIAVAIIYYFVLVYLIRYQNYGILLISVPKVLIYALVITSSMMFTFGVYAMRSTFKRKANASGTAIGTAFTLLVGVIAGCGCSTPILYSVTALGLSIVEVSAFASFITRYSAEIISVMLVVNVLLIAYYASRTSVSRR